MLAEKIKQDLKNAMKEKARDKVRTLRLLRAELVNMGKEKRYRAAKKEGGLSEGEIEKKSELTDKEALEAVVSEVKKRREAIEEFKKGGREDLVKKEQEELAVLKEYMPEQMDEAEVRKEAARVIKETGAGAMQDMGKVMKELMPRLKGRADGSLVSRVVKEILGEDD